VFTPCANPTTAAAQSPSPAEQRIAAAEGALAHSKSADAYNALALALARRARETSDAAYYTRADAAIDESLRLAPDNFEAQKMRVLVLLGRREFVKALDLARALNGRNADDLLIYGFLTDAHAELGHYKEAEEACQWMLDLQPGNIPAFTRAAYLREIFGDIEGAIDLMRQAYDRTPPSEVEDRAWLLAQLGHLALLGGRVDEAEHVLNQALVLFPNYQYGLANLAKVRTAQKRYEDAVTLLRRRYERAAHPETLFALAEALERAGHAKDAHAAYLEFEKKATAAMTVADNSNRELTLLYADHLQRPADALRVARNELDRRQNVYTLDSYAWALHVNGREAEARTYIDRALAVGIQDPVILGHAKAIKKN
jgi:tetratricopeptide (TPR) repeat protein